MNELTEEECAKQLKQEIASYKWYEDRIAALEAELAECREMLRENKQCPDCGGRIDLPPGHVEACYCIPLIRMLRKELADCWAKLEGR